MATAVGNLYIRIGAETKQLNADLRAADKQIRAFGKQMKDAGASLTQNVTLPILAIGAGAVKAFGDIEALQKGLISVMGSAAAASVEFEKLKEVAKLPGLGLEEAVKGSVNLQSAGFSADQAREALLQFGNALATVGKGKNELNLVVLALTQLQNKTSGFGQDLRQLVEQLPQLRTALTNSFGTADSEAIAKLGVTGKQVVETLVGEFAKLPRVTGGIKNAFENLSDSTKVAFAKLGETLNKTLNIEGFLNKLGDAITRLTNAFGSLSPQTQKMIITFVGIAAAMGPILFIGGQLASSFSAIIAAMKVVGITATLSLGPIGGVVLAIAAAVTILIVKWDDIKETMDQVGLSSIDLSKAFEFLAGVIKTGLTIIRLAVDLFGNLVGTIVRLKAAIDNKITWTEFANSTVDAFKETGKNAITGFVDAVETGAKKINIAGSTSGTDRLSGYAKLREGTGGASFTPKAKAGKKVDQFSALPEDVAIKAGLLGNDIFLPITGELPKLNKVPEALNRIALSVKSILSPLGEVRASMSETFKDTVESVTDYAQRQLERIVEKLKEGNDKVINGLSAASSLIQPALQFTQQLLDNQGQSLANKEAQERAYVEKTVKNEDEKAKRLAAIDKKYDDEKRKLQRKQAIQNKVASIFQAIISTFEGVARALALGPAGIPLVPYIKGLGLANVAAIAAAPLPSLAIGTNRVKSDGLAQIHKNEAIVPAKVAQGGFNLANGAIELIGKISGTDIILGQRNSNELYNRMYA
jgi:tape measure domain-containing protein